MKLYTINATFLHDYKGTRITGEVEQSHGSRATGKREIKKYLERNYKNVKIIAWKINEL